MKAFFIILAVFVMSAMSCEQTVELDFPETQPLVVVDGWIDQGEGPKVILTRSLPYFAGMDSATYRDLVVSKAKVKVSTDSFSEVLTLHYDERYFPPYIYQGFSIKGETGKSYHLEVTIGGDTLYASTRIPESPVIDSLWLKPNPLHDTLKQLMLRFTDPLETRDYYRVFSRVQGSGNDYRPSYVSVFADAGFSGSIVDIPVFKGYTGEGSREDLFYQSNDTVYIKFCTITDSSYQFWRNLQSEQMNAVNPFATSVLNIEGNVRGNAKGIWTGYGVDYERIVIP